MTAWQWDAQALTIDPQSAARVNAAVGSTPGRGYFGPMTYFTAEIARFIRDASTPASEIYNFVSQRCPAFDHPIPLRKNFRPGVSKDGHAVYVDRVLNRWHDFELYLWPAQEKADGTISDSTDGSSMPLGSVVVPNNHQAKQGATAAMMPLARGAVTPDQIAAKLIPHTTVFTASNLGPAPAGGNPFPANSLGGYNTGNYGAWAGKSVAGHAPLGQMMRLNHNWQISSKAPDWEKTFAAQLRDHGTVCRDRSTDVSLHGLDDGGMGESIDAWIEAGVPFVKPSSGVPRMTVKFQYIDWTQLEFCLPPARP